MSSDARSHGAPYTGLRPMRAGSAVARILAVALSPDELTRLPRHILAPDASLRRARLADLTARELRSTDAPTLVLSPLVARGFDAMDLLTTLREVGFAGRYLVLASGVPHIALIRAEMRALAGRLNVDIIAPGAGPVLHLV